MVAIVHHLRCCEARPPWKNRLYRWVEQQYLASVEGFIFNSNATRTDVERLVGSDRPAVVASPGGDRLPGKITAGQIAIRALAPGPFKIICVANLIPRKEVHTLISGPGQSASPGLATFGRRQSDHGYFLCRQHSPPN